MDKCEKCGVGLSEEDFVPCDLHDEQCPLLAAFNSAMEKAIRSDQQKGQQT